MPRPRAICVLLILAVITFVAMLYWPVLGFDYVWDDRALFINNPDLRLSQHVWHALSLPILPGTTYFRPLPLATFALQFQWLGISPIYAHAGNLIIHLINVVLVFIIANETLVKHASTKRTLKLKALLAALLYGIHPALIEPVTWVAGRFDLMVVLFALTALLAALRLSGWLRLTVAGIAFFCATLSKEMAITLPILIFIMLWVTRYVNIPWRELPLTVLRKDGYLYLALLAAGFTYLVIRFTALDQMSHTDPVVESEFNGLVDHISFVGHTLLFYARMTAWPFADINPMHPFSPESMSIADKVIGIGLLLSVLTLAVWAIMKRSLLGIFFITWWIALLPILNIIPLTIGGNIGHERFLALPLVFASLGVVTLHQPQNLFRIAQYSVRYLVPALVIGWTMIASANLHVTLPLWRDDLTLWTWAYARYPGTPFVQFSYAAAAIRMGQLEVAGRVFDDMQHGGGIDKPSLRVLYGQWLHRQGDAVRAIEEITTGLSEIYLPHKDLERYNILLHSASIKGFGNIWLIQFAYTALAEAYNSTQHFDDALDASNTTLFYTPHYPPALLAKSLALYGLDREEEAEQTFRQAMFYYTPAGREDAKSIKNQFITQLCGQWPSQTPKLCTIPQQT